MFRYSPRVTGDVPSRRVRALVAPSPRTQRVVLFGGLSALPQSERWEPTVWLSDLYTIDTGTHHLPAMCEIHLFLMLVVLGACVYYAASFQCQAVTVAASQPPPVLTKPCAYRTGVAWNGYLVVFTGQPEVALLNLGTCILQ